MVRIIGIAHPTGRDSNSYKGTDLTKDDLQNTQQFLGLPIFDNHDKTVQPIAFIEKASLDKEGNLWIATSIIDEKLPHGKRLVEKIKSGEYGGISLGSINEVDKSTQEVLRRCVVEASLCPGPSGARENTRIVLTLAHRDSGSGSGETSSSPEEIELDLIPVQRVGLIEDTGEEIAVETAHSEISSKRHSITPGDSIYERSEEEETRKTMPLSESKKFDAGFDRTSLPENNSTYGADLLPSATNQATQKTSRSLDTSTATESRPSVYSDSTRRTPADIFLTTHIPRFIFSPDSIKAATSSMTTPETPSSIPPVSSIPSGLSHPSGGTGSILPSGAGTSLDSGKYTRDPRLPVPSASKSSTTSGGGKLSTDRPRDANGKYLPFKKSGADPTSPATDKHREDSIEEPIEEDQEKMDATDATPEMSRTPMDPPSGRVLDKVVLTADEFTKMQMRANQVEETERQMKELRDYKEKIERERRETEKKTKFSQVQRMIQEVEESLKFVEELDADTEDPEDRATLLNYKTQLHEKLQKADELFEKTPEELDSLRSTQLVLTAASRTFAKMHAKQKATLMGKFEDIQREVENSKRQSNRKRPHPGVDPTGNPAHTGESEFDLSSGSVVGGTPAVAPSRYGGSHSRGGYGIPGSHSVSGYASGGSRPTPTPRVSSATGEDPYVTYYKSEILKDAEYPESHGFSPFIFSQISNPEDTNKNIFDTIHQKLSGGNWVSLINMKEPFFTNKEWHSQSYEMPMMEGEWRIPESPAFKRVRARSYGY